MNDKDLEQIIGQLFIIGFEGHSVTPSSPVIKDLAKRNLGGVILFDKLLAKKKSQNNIVSKQQLQQLTADLQANAHTPLFIGIDQEGGRVNRLREDCGFTTTPSAAELGNDTSTVSTEQAGQQTATLLSELGINLNFAPVVDLNVCKQNPIIGQYERAFSADPQKVCNHAQTWIAQHSQHDILSCIKHFPGHGSSRKDSHLGFVDISKTWNPTELEPYKKLIKKNIIQTVMVGHLFHDDLDPHYPATLSREIITETLRRKLKFDGIVISDDMQMKAITDHYGLEEGCCRAIEAGIDLIIIGNNLEHDPKILGRMQQAVLLAVQRGTVTTARIKESYRRIMRVKGELCKKAKQPPTQ